MLSNTIIMEAYRTGKLKFPNVKKQLDNKTSSLKRSLLRNLMSLIILASWKCSPESKTL